MMRCANVNGKLSFVIPVVFHNLKGYDSHHLMEKLGAYKRHRVQVIPNTLEKYIWCSLGNLRFFDSLQYMDTSLQKLVDYLTHEGKGNFTNMCKFIPDAEPDLLLRKEVNPYDYVD